jgi:tRNA modification GTPase
VEISAHGSPIVLKQIVASAMDAGARLAEPGEFTLRAFVSGRMDLVQAEAVADLIDAATPLQARAAFDQLNGTLTAAIGEIDRLLFDLIARLEASIDFPDEGFHSSSRESPTWASRASSMHCSGRRERL